jgi:hypothetical protein
MHTTPEQCCGPGSLLKGSIRIRIPITVISWIQICNNLQITSHNVWKMCLLEHFLMVLRLYSGARTRIRIKVKGRVRIRTRINVMRIRNIAPEIPFYMGILALFYFTVSSCVFVTKPDNNLRLIFYLAKFVLSQIAGRKIRVVQYIAGAVLINWLGIVLTAQQ